MEVRIYSSQYKEEWDLCVRNSKNGTFLHCRDFMEYHADRFRDYSLMFYSDKALLGIMPGHIDNQTFYTHKGLTYGGLIMSKTATTKDVLSIFECLLAMLSARGIRKIVYKAVPHIYHRLPAEEDLYALFRYNATIVERNISSTVFIPSKISYSDSRKRGLLKAKKNGLKIKESRDFYPFWEILTYNLQKKYNTKPVHSIDEIGSLKQKFENEIHLLTVADRHDRVIGGCLFFEMENLVHAQYTAALDEGKQMGAIDMLIDHIINTVCADKTYFDYGISSENNGTYLNESLVYQKEGFGARATVYDIYAIDL